MTRFGGSSGILIALAMVLGMEFVSFFLGINAFGVLVTGLVLGSLYALIALGYTMVYGIIELINFAHGDVFAVGAFASLIFLGWFNNDMAVNGTNYNEGSQLVHILGVTFHLDVVWVVVATVAITMVLSAVVCGLLGVTIERIAYRPLRNSPRLAPLITAIGVSFIIENLLLQWRGGQIINYPTVMPIREYAWFQVPVSNVDIVVICSALAAMLVLDRFVNQTKLGKAMRAVAQDREAALMMGINVDRIISLTFFVGSAIAGVGSVVYGMYLGGIGSNMGFSLGLFAFTAAVMGGIGNIRGAMVGGLLIGIIKRFIDSLGGSTGTEWADTVVFAILILVLVLRPAGLLGSQVPEKV